MSAVTLENDILTLEYHLHELPTAQHKAGLAGLLVFIESMKARKMEHIPKVEHLSESTARIAFTKESLQAVFDDLYDAKWVERKTKGKVKNFKRMEEVEEKQNGKVKKVKYYIYDEVEPKGQFLNALYPEAADGYLKLWRDMLWNILRGIPLTRNTYKIRANEKPSDLSSEFWKDFQTMITKLQKGVVYTKGFKSSIFIGAEDENAERIPFQGTVDQIFLLHFWPIATPIYTPRELSIERTEEQFRILYKDGGYVLAVPEPADLNSFVDDTIAYLKSIDGTMAGYRPKNTLIDVFEESALEYLHGFARKKIFEKEFRYSMNAVEIYHMQKRGNRINQVAVERITPKRSIIREYDSIRGSYLNPFYKTFYLKNLLREAHWYENADEEFYEKPMPFFVYKPKKTPGTLRFFGLDVRKKFQTIEEQLKRKQKGGEKMTETEKRGELSVRIYRMIRQFVQRRAEEKSNVKYQEIQIDEKGYKIYPKDYREAVENVCSGAFLAMRSRREQDFVEYFTGTICSVPHLLPEKDFMALTNALMEDWQTVKTISMLALSAHSYFFAPKTADKKED